jgi:hypothetical protein
MTDFIYYYKGLAKHREVRLLADTEIPENIT